MTASSLTRQRWVLWHPFLFQYRFPHTLLLWDTVFELSFRQIFMSTQILLKTPSNKAAQHFLFPFFKSLIPFTRQNFFHCSSSFLTHLFSFSVLTPLNVLLLLSPFFILPHYTTPKPFHSSRPSCLLCSFPFSSFLPNWLPPTFCSLFVW